MRTKDIELLEEDQIIIITDQRDIKEIEMRKKDNGFQPPKNELYSFNPDFDGNYS